MSQSILFLMWVHALNTPTAEVHWAVLTLPKLTCLLKNIPPEINYVNLTHKGVSCHATLKNKLSANFNSCARGCGGRGGGQIAFRGKLKSSCSLAWKLGIMAIKSEWVIKSCPNALNIPFRIALWNLSRALKNLDSLENYNSRQFLKKCLFPTLLQTWPLISIPVLRAGKGHKRDIHGQKLCHHYSD